MQIHSPAELTAPGSRCPAMLHIKKIAKSLDEKRTLLAASRKELEALLEKLEPNAQPPIVVRLSAASLDRRCSASLTESIDLYHMLMRDPYVFVSQVRAVADLVHAQTRLAREHQLISSMVEQVLT